MYVCVLLSHVPMSHSFPLTANGKVDVRALPPADDAAAFDDPDAVVGARTPTEMILCDIWSNLLGVWAALGSDFYALFPNFLLLPFL